MQLHHAGHEATRLPLIPLALLRALLPRAERDEVIADLAAEYAQMEVAAGTASARRWFWRQAVQSAPPERAVSVATLSETSRELGVAE